MFNDDVVFFKNFVFFWMIESEIKKKRVKSKIMIKEKENELCRFDCFYFCLCEIKVY